MLRKMTVSALLMAALAASASAGITDVTISQTDPGATLPGYVANDIKIAISGEWTGAQLLTSDLGVGAIYQNPVGGDVPPSQALVNAIPTVALDSFMANGGLTADTSGDVLVVGASANFDGDGIKKFSDSQIDVTWAPATGVHPTDVSDYVIGRITLGTEVNGTFDFLIATEDGFMPILGRVHGGVVNMAAGPDDINRDGVVGDADLNLLLSGYGNSYDQSDLQSLLESFGQTAPFGPTGGGGLSAVRQSVPEPSTVVLILLGALGLAPRMRRRRRFCASSAWQRWSSDHRP